MKCQVSKEFIESQLRRGCLSERDYRNYKWRIRRQREIRNRILLLAFTVCLVLVMAVSYYSITSYAESEIGTVCILPNIHSFVNSIFKKIEHIFGIYVCLLDLVMI